MAAQDTAVGVLTKSCAGCHNAKMNSGKLRLDTLEALAAGGMHGPAVIAGDSASSYLYQRITATDAMQRMPPAGPALPPEQVEMIRKWIDGGAPGLPAVAARTVKKHWAYIKPERPQVPAANGAAANPIDAFVLAKLSQQRLQPSPPAAKEKLLRRVTLDLTGLPPAPQEIDAFLADTREGAYERVVDRLLASPHYGERWALPWLDYARYADTNGYEADFRRTMWKYRDWVIQALNRDLPFDQFTIQQLAGDMLPGATDDQRIATGFHRNTMYNEEGGVDKDESYFEVLVDRVNTTSTVWLGSTIGCSQCHNHKYDPFSQAEYYQLMAFFSNADKKAIPNGSSSTKYQEPILDLPTPEQARKRAALKARIDALETELKTSTPRLEAAQREWEQEVRRAESNWTPLQPVRASAANGAVLTPRADSSILASGANPLEESYTIEAASNLRKITALRLEALPDQTLPRGGPGRDTYGNFLITTLQLEVWRGTWQPVAFRQPRADDGRINDTRRKQLWEVDASKDEKRLPRQLVLPLASSLDLGKDAHLRITIRQESRLAGQSLGLFRLSVTSEKEPETIISVRAKLRPVLQAEPSARSTEDMDALAKHYRTVAPSLRKQREELVSLKKQLDSLGIVTALVLRENREVDRPTDYVRIRGGFSAKAAQVEAGVPAVLGAFPDNELPNRLALAQWLVSKENPLTARVTVNRVWEQYFGRGLVETGEDFGSQGQPPSHPELLDWLAVEFMDDGWSLKKLHRIIVTSNTYQQTSSGSAASWKADPLNRWLSRGPRTRLPAEVVRDVTLAASGLLAPAVGGPSVFPPQPPGIWDLPYNDDQWTESTGPDRYRRGLYTFRRRSAPYPAFTNFDAPSREACTVRRSRTTTPTQALTTLNDTAFFETARALAARLLKEGGRDDKDKLDLGFRLCTSRHAKPAEIDQLLTWQHKEREYFAAHPEEAAKLGGKPDQAVWTMTANVLLNLDETLVKE